MDKLVEIEEDLQYITVASRKDLKEHALIRIVLSTLADIEEINNITKGDLEIKKSNSRQAFALNLRKGGKSRKAPIDETTYEILSEISKNYTRRQRIFDYTYEEIDKMIAKYSPSSKRYGLNELRKGVIKILEDNLLNVPVEEIFNMNFWELFDFLSEFHPMFSGMWDLKDDDVAQDYFRMLSKRHGISDYSEISEISGESIERIEKLMKKKWFQSYLEF
uniref:Site-specific integrase n=1 Tax=Geoglobus ahangari TaxID=113653 RepID=A0A7C3YNU0_9EURY